MRVVSAERGDRSACVYIVRAAGLSGAGPGWAVTLRGPNGLERAPCRFEGAAAPCTPAGPAETLRRVGARLNVR